MKKILILIPIISIVLIIVGISQSQIVDPDNNESIISSENNLSESAAETRAIYGFLNDENQWIVMSSTLDGLEKEVLTSINLVGNYSTGQAGVVLIQTPSNGEYLFLSKSREYNPDNFWLVSLDSKQTEQIILPFKHRMGGYPTMSPDGSTILFVSENNDELWQMDVSSKKIEKVLSGFKNDGIHPSLWSDKGDRVLISLMSPEEYGTFEPSTKKFTKLNTNFEKPGTFPTWIDDENLLFYHHDMAEGKNLLYRYNLFWNSAEKIHETYPSRMLFFEVLDSKDLFLVLQPLDPNLALNCHFLLVDFEKNVEEILSEDYVSCNTYSYPNFHLYSNDEKLIFGKGDSVEGEKKLSRIISFSNQTTSSIHSFDFNTREQKPIFVGQPFQVNYQLLDFHEFSGTIAYLEHNFSNNESKEFKIMLSDLEGASPIEIYSGKFMNFYGWLE